MNALVCSTMLLVLGCSNSRSDVQAAPAQQPAPGAKDSKMTQELTWAMTKQAGTLHVTYHFENHTGDVVYVNDGLVVQTGNDTFSKINTNVVPSKLDDSTLLITVGTPSGDVPAGAPVPGLYVKVPKGGTFDGARDLLLPFQTRDAMGRVVMLGDKFQKAAFALQAIHGEPSKWREIQTDKGMVKIPDAPTTLLIRADPQPLP